MEDLRFALLVIGGCAIIGILAHGLWSLRKNSISASKTPRIEPNQTSDETVKSEQGFDEFGLGEVRVVKRASDEHNGQSAGVHGDEHAHASTGHADQVSFTIDADDIRSSDIDQDLGTSEAADEQKSDLDLDDLSIRHMQDAPSVKESEPEAEQPKKLYASVVSNPKPTVQKSTPSETPPETIPEPPPFLLKEEEASKMTSIQPDEKPVDEVDDFSLDQVPVSGKTESKPVSEESESPAPRKRPRSTIRKRIEPTLGDDQMRMSFDEEVTIDGGAVADSATTPTIQQGQHDGKDAQSPVPEQEVLVLNVRAPQDQEIPGASLLPLLLTLGFKFGDQDIFHRHVNSNGKGPVLFSLANMFKPGVFDIDNLENFSTQGVSLFMILPIEGEPHQVFNMMHNAARKIAEEFSAQILDGRRSVLTKQGLQQYVEKIREFERQRMIARS